MKKAAVGMIILAMGWPGLHAWALELPWEQKSPAPPPKSAPAESPPAPEARRTPPGPQSELDELRQAANAGEPEAQAVLGLAYTLGELGLRADDQQAAIWFRRAADQGNPMAQYVLGLMYEEGRGVPRNIRKARQWFRKAAAAGLPAAAEKLR